MKDELGEKIMKEFTGLRSITHNYLTDSDDEFKKEKRHKKVCHKMKTQI